MKKITLLAAAVVCCLSVMTGCRKIEEQPAAPDPKVSQETESRETAAPEVKTEAVSEAVKEVPAKAAEAVTENSSAGAAEAVTESSSVEAEAATENGEENTEGLSVKEEDALPAAAAEKKGGKVVVYNWGEYLDPDVLDQFEEETGIKVIYEEFETNEIMYPKVAAGAIAYDVVCPSDYMIDKMLKNDLLAEINFDNIPNITNIGETYMSWSEEFDPGNRYSVPYCWGTVGILYNKTMVDDPVDSWDILWNEKYKDNILMQDSVRDALMVTLKKLGYSMNTESEEELAEATQLLIDQKPLVQAYVIDQVRDKMIGDEAALGVIYSGEAIYTQRENENLEYVIPKEGTNLWIDSWVIPKNAQNKENAEAFINFMCRPDIALKNFDYITYSTPNTAARELIEDEDIRNSTIAFPTDDMLKNCETFHYLGDELDNLYTEYWNKVKSS